MRKPRFFIRLSFSRQHANVRRISSLFIIVLIYSSISIAVAQNPPVPCNQITEEMGFTVRSVKVVGRWVPNELLERLKTIIQVGKPFSPAVLGPAQETVRDELAKSEILSLPVVGATSILFITQDVCDVSDQEHPRTVEITIYPYYLRVDLLNVGSNVLPIPRSASATFYRNVPVVLLATTPVFRVNNDRRYGFSVGVQTHTDLLNPAGRNKNKATKLYVGVGIRYSLTDPFYNVSPVVTLTRQPVSERLLGWAFSGQYATGRQPLGAGFYQVDRFHVQGDLQGRRHKGLLAAYSVGGGIRWLQNRFSDGSPEASNIDKGWEVRALGQGNPGRGTSRLGLWFDAGYPNLKSNPYQRLAGRAGYAVELGRSHQSMGFDLTLGAGHAWGATPAYNRFFAGNTTWNFLYETLSAPSLKQLPTGPVLRSFGEQQGGLSNATGQVSGGTGYWNLGLNLSFPIKKWSRPLIPDIAVDERSNLSRKLKGATELASAGIFSYLTETEGRPDNEETEAEVERIMNKDVRPVVGYLADRANVYAIKPMLLVDVAHLSGRDLSRQTWLAVGIGVQLNVVNARFEAGYLNTIAGTNTNTGNVFLRLSIQNFY